jgi:hypothetical protein
MMLIVRNRETGTAPGVIHANGCRKGNVWKYLERLLFASSLPNPANIPDDLTVITWDTSDKESALIRSLRRSFTGGPCMVLGKGIKQWYRHQITLTMEYLETCDTRYVMGIDAWDAMFVQSPARILEVFKSSFAKRYCLVYGAELNFWPDQYTGPYKAHEEARASQEGATRWKYLNSGCFIGEVDFCKKWYAECLALADKHEQGFGNDEQGLVHIRFGQHPRCDNMVTLDYQCQMFQNLFGMNGSELDLIEADSVVTATVE